VKHQTQIIVTMIVGFSLLAFFLAGLKVALFIGLALTLVAALFVYRGGIFTFIGEVKVELGKCSWPWDPNQTGLKKYKELIESTAVVIVSTIMLAGFVTTSDLVLAHVVGFLTGGGMTK
jgi:preprotein translocase subunit SecE